HLKMYSMDGLLASHREMLECMPSKHQYPARVYRPDPELYRRAQDAVQQVGSNMNAHVIEFLHWLAGDTDVLPMRPNPAQDGGQVRGDADASGRRS
ncbi:hypothetical protein, partial [Nocardia higoensis]|uniref:hypothetical protein n=1 Tax=Nocardia higoensis TaxID=228599 RepID=UPI001E612A58